MIARAKSYQGSVGFILALVVIFLGILMALDILTATPEHLGWMFILTGAAILL